MADRQGAAPTEVIEIELTGGGPLQLSPDGPSDQPDDRPPPVNWRRAVGIALVAGTVVGIGGAVFLSGIDDETEGATTTLPADELSTLITTPPTLRPLDTLPPPGFDDRGAAVDDSPQATTSQDRSLFAEVTVPLYPENTTVDAASALAIGIEPAIVRLGDDVARRSHTHIELGVDGYALDVTIRRDPASDRYQLTFESNGTTEEAIVDVATNSTYVNPGTENQAVILNDDILAGSGASDINELFDGLLLGPVRPDTFSTAVTTGGAMFDLDGVGPARMFETRVDGSAVPEWQMYSFAPVFEFRPEDAPAELEYFVYVDQGGDVVQVDGVSMIGDVPQLIEHRIQRLDMAFQITLPELVSGNTVPAPPPSTTPVTAP